MRQVAADICRLVSIASLVITITAGMPAMAQPGQMPSVEPSENWCGTQQIFERNYLRKNGMAPKACEQFGVCDDPATRDGWIFGAGDPIIYVRLAIHYFAEDDGQYPTSTREEIAAQLEHLNSDYAPLGMQFIAQINQINSTQWRVIDESEIDPMKIATATAPDSFLNVWLPYVNFSYSFGTFPWDPNAQTATGGIVMAQFHWQGGPSSVFGHEIGHTLGLWHTFHGVDEVAECGDCYEYVGAQPAEADLLGDFCYDTPPTATQTTCKNTSGVDPCSGLPWGYTQPENFMNYTPEACMSLFTPQQWGRLRCWTANALDSWTEPFSAGAQNSFGLSPLDVTFSAGSHREVLSWSWDFGDGQTSDQDTVVHRYEQPGYYSVSVQLTTPEGAYVKEFPGMVSAYADSMMAADIGGNPGQTVRVDVSVRNFVPLKEIVIPFSWAGPLNLTLTSYSTDGLRTAYFETQALADISFSLKRAVIDLICSSSGAQPYLEPGDGPVVSLFFRIPAGAPDSLNPIDMNGFTTWNPLFTTYAGSYAPVVTSGSVGVGLSCCTGPTVGNIDRSADNLVTMSDLTALIDFLYISLTPPTCIDDADIDLSGQPDPVAGDVTMSDLTILIDHLFISLTPLPPCP